MSDPASRRSSWRRAPPRAGRGLFGWPLLLALACAHARPRSPEELRAAFAEALREDDADAAFALLAPDVQASIGRDAFRRRWKENQRERADALTALDELDPAEGRATRGGRTMHEGGRMIEWTEVGGRYVVVSGLPGIPETSTPEATLRALVSLLRESDRGRLAAVLSPELLESGEQDFRARADTIEKALAEPGAITYGADGSRAVLRYAPGRTIVLEQAERGWRIIELR